MKEILAGDGFENAVKELGIVAELGYAGPEYEVWAVIDCDFDMLCEIPDDEWKENWGWWRSAEGSVLGVPDGSFRVNGKPMLAWCGDSRKHSKVEWKNLEQDEKAMYGDYDGFMATWYPDEFGSLTEYLEYEMGVTSARNIVALAMDIAHYNGMCMADLFKLYEGGHNNDRYTVL